MHTVNRVTLVGIISEGPFYKTDPAGHESATFTVETLRVWKTRDGRERQEEQYTPCIVWDGILKTVKDKLTLGSHVYIEGYLRTRDHMEVVIDSLSLL